MGLFDYKDYKVVINPEAVIIPPFIEIWNRDKTKDKKKATKEISYIYFLCDFKSPYHIYPDEERDVKVREDFIKDPDWKPDEKILEGIKKYEEFQETYSMRFLKSCKQALEKLKTYFNRVDFNQLDEKGNPIYKLSDVVRALKDAGPIMESLEKIQNKVEQELQTESKIRGNKNIRDRER